MKFEGRDQEYFEVVDVNSKNCHHLNNSRESELSLLWFNTDGNILEIDSIEHGFDTDQIVCLTEFHKVKNIKVNGVRLLRFNRSFYCVLDHDVEVSCKGILYFGSSSVPIITPSDKDKKTLDAVWQMLTIEMQERDNLQLEMLQMMLKRILILCTRIYKRQSNYDAVDNESLDSIREFNFLVERHFRDYHRVSDYAKLLHKSPKTISNIFSKTGGKSPLETINSRIMIEARRLLIHSAYSISEVAFELGYDDIQAFSRFFKKHQGVSPSAFQKSHSLQVR